jgi:hypothetical protein
VDEHVALLDAISVTLAERLKELGGVVKLTHSQYSSNPVVIDAIARFLATGQFPISGSAPAADLCRSGVELRPPNSSDLNRGASNSKESEFKADASNFGYIYTPDVSLVSPVDKSKL